MKSVIIFTILLLAGVSFHGQKRVTGTEELIRGLESKLTVAILQGDAPSVERILADDYIEINAQGLLTRKADLMAIARARAAAPQAQSVGRRLLSMRPICACMEILLFWSGVSRLAISLWIIKFRRTLLKRQPQQIPCRNGL